MKKIKHLADLTDHKSPVLPQGSGLLHRLREQTQFAGIPDLDGPSRMVYCARGTFTIYDISIHRRSRSFLARTSGRPWSRWDTLITPTNYYSVWHNAKLCIPAVADNPWQIDTVWSARQLDDLLEDIRDPNPWLQTAAPAVPEPAPRSERWYRTMIPSCPFESRLAMLF